MTNANISLENEAFAAYISKGQAIYGFMLTPEYIVNGFKIESIEYQVSTSPPTLNLKKLLEKYKTVIIIKDDNKPRVTIYTQDADYKD